MPLQCTMSSIFDWEVRRLGMRDTLRQGTITVSGFWYFHKNCRFLWGLFIYLLSIQSFFSIYETLRDSSMVDFKIIFIEKYFKCRCSNMFFSYYQLLIKRAMETPKSHIKQFWIYNYKTKTCFLKSIEIPTNFQNILN